MSGVMQCIDVSGRRPLVTLKYNMWPLIHSRWSDLLVITPAA